MAKIEKELTLKLACEEIDRLIITNFGGKFHGLVRVPMTRLMYDASKEKIGGDPLTYYAAKGLVERVKPGDTVILTTGFYVARWLQPETDGPPGIAALARILNVGLEATPIFVVGEKFKGIVSACVRGAGLREFNLDEVKYASRRFAVVKFPVKESAAEKEADRLLNLLNPSALISLETPGRNIKGVHHSMMGLDISPVTAKVDLMFQKARSKGIFTIGIGDGGNEIGMGNIRDTIEKHVWLATECRCPCGSGTASAIETDVLIPAYTSNFGGYGLEAAIALLLDEAELMHDGAEEKRILDEGARAGMMMSPWGLTSTGVDQLPEVIGVRVVELLRYMLESRLKEDKRKEAYRNPPKDMDEKVIKMLREYGGTMD
jgi:hypothetical protein